MHVCVVYQTTSNFGNKCDHPFAASAPSLTAHVRCNPGLETLLEHLTGEGLIDSLIFYEPRSFSLEEKTKLCSSRASYVALRFMCCTLPLS